MPACIDCWYNGYVVITLDCISLSHRHHLEPKADMHIGEPFMPEIYLVFSSPRIIYCFGLNISSERCK